MKKSITTLFITLCLLTMNSVPIHASTPQVDEDPVIINIESEDSTTTYYFSDDSKLVYDGEKYTVIVPEYASDYIPPETQTYSAGAVAGVIWAVISTALTACTIIEWTVGENPCEIAYKYLLKVVISPRTGKYRVGSVYHQGYIPGCEPRNSLPCNSGYYEYTFIPM